MYKKQTAPLIIFIFKMVMTLKNRPGVDEAQIGLSPWPKHAQSYTYKLIFL